MTENVKFPVPMHHPKTGGETSAGTRSSLRVLEARGWKRGPKPSHDPTDDPKSPTPTIPPKKAPPSASDKS